MKSLLAGILLLGFVTSANAVFIDNGRYTTDTTSGLDWLDLTETMGMSYDTVVTEMAVGGAYEGWVYATGVQFTQMVANFTNTVALANDDLHYYGEGPDSIDQLVQLLGNTNTVNPTNIATALNHSYGLIQDELGYSYIRMAVIEDKAESELQQDYSKAYGGALRRGSSEHIVGSFLVKASVSVPEASSLLLLGFGLFGLIVGARRQA